jgi:hypothetical protein
MASLLGTDGRFGGIGLMIEKLPFAAAAGGFLDMAELPFALANHPVSKKFLADPVRFRSHRRRAVARLW